MAQIFFVQFVFVNKLKYLSYYHTHYFCTVEHDAFKLTNNLQSESFSTSPHISVSSIVVPGLRLLSKMLQVIFVVGMQHLLVRHRRAHLGKLLEKLLVTALQNIHLWIVQERVLALVPVSIFLSQESVPVKEIRVKTISTKPCVIGIRMCDK